jgi:hypothetical protein
MVKHAVIFVLFGRYAAFFKFALELNTIGYPISYGVDHLVPATLIWLPIWLGQKKKNSEPPLSAQI